MAFRFFQRVRIERRNRLAAQYGLDEGWARLVWDDWVQRSTRELRASAQGLLALQQRHTWSAQEFEREYSFLVNPFVRIPPPSLGGSTTSNRAVHSSPRFWRAPLAWFLHSQPRAQSLLLALSMLVPVLSLAELIRTNPHLWGLALGAGLLLLAALSIHPLLLRHARQIAFWSRLAVCLARAQSAAADDRDQDQHSALLFRSFCLQELASKERQQLESAIEPRGLSRVFTTPFAHVFTRSSNVGQPAMSESHRPDSQGPAPIHLNRSEAQGVSQEAADPVPSWTSKPSRSAARRL